MFFTENKQNDPLIITKYPSSTATCGVVADTNSHVKAYTAVTRFYYGFRVLNRIEQNADTC